MGKKKKDPRFRHELKYVISVDDANRFLADIQDYGAWDPHSGETHSYEIASTYYDTDNLRFYVDREESVGYRRKIRLRSYNTDGKSTALFIEIKERHRKYVFKKRINLTSDRVLSLGIRHDQLPLDYVLEDLEDSEAAREMVYLHKRLELHPVSIIRYIRKAFIPAHERGMRITLDTKLTAGGHWLNKFDPDIEKPLLAESHGVLEIKSFQSIPIWLASALQRYGVPQCRFSKYCLGVDAMLGPSKKWMTMTDKKPLEQLQQVA